jgi:hypothetical protein
MVWLLFCAPPSRLQAAQHAARLKDVEASLARRFAQAQQVLVDELELGYVVRETQSETE